MPTTPPAIHLDGVTLPDLPDSVATPMYDRDSLRRSIVHIGVGGFHRAHLATYIDELCRAGNVDWSITGAGVLAGDAKIATVLAEQDYLYTLITRGNAHADIRVIGSLVGFVHASPERDPLVELIASPDTQIVSLTVTEGGYPIDDVTSEFNAESPNAAPGSAFGALAAGLALRHARRLAPITVISCDNIISNGTAARTSTLGIAATHGADVADWIATQIAFPNSMVDRITPATTDADRAWLADHARVDDGWPVVTEPFRQWVIEDHFAGERLPLEQLDVIVTDHVEPYELMKLRLLNAGHSSLAYLSALLGFATVDQALADDQIRSFLTEFLVREALPTVPAVAGIDLDEYIASLIERFSNPAIGDQIARLCLDGSVKFPKFLIPTVRSQVATEGPVELSALALAGWCHYLNGIDEAGAPISLSPDPALESAVGFARASVSDPARFLEFEQVFEPSLRTGRFADSFSSALTSIRSTGVRSALDAALS